MRIAITGHSKINDDVVKDVILRTIEKHPKAEFICGMARGTDMVAAQAALSMGNKVHAYIPCLGQQVRWEESQQKRYFKILSHPLVEIHYVQEESWTKGCFFRRNSAMAKAGADQLLAFMRDEKSGTGHCVGRFEIEGIPINIYHPENKTWEKR